MRTSLSIEWGVCFGCGRDPQRCHCGLDEAQLEQIRLAEGAEALEDPDAEYPHFAPDPEGL